MNSTNLQGLLAFLIITLTLPSPITFPDNCAAKLPKYFSRLFKTNTQRHSWSFYPPHSWSSGTNTFGDYLRISAMKCAVGSKVLYWPWCLLVVFVGGGIFFGYIEKEGLLLLIILAIITIITSKTKTVKLCVYGLRRLFCLSCSQIFGYIARMEQALISKLYSSTFNQ